MLDIENNKQDAQMLMSMLQTGDMLLAMNGCGDVETSIIPKELVKDLLDVDPDQKTDIVVVGQRPDGSETIAVANVESLSHTFFSMLHSIAVLITLRSRRMETVDKDSPAETVEVIVQSAQFAIDNLLFEDEVPLPAEMKTVCLEALSSNILGCVADKLETLQPWTDFFEKNKDFFEADEDEYKRLYKAFVLG